MRANKWLLCWATLVMSALLAFSLLVYGIDPYFHYHKPYTDKYYYKLDSQRDQNDGISKHFEYDGIITGTSMTEYFKVSEAENIFGGHFIKVPYPGASYKEINDNLSRAIKSNPNIRTIIRGLDMDYFTNDADLMRTDLGIFPYHLYDKNPFNDVKYLLNRDVIISSLDMIAESYNDDFVPGITSFDYNRSDIWTHGKNAVIPEGKVLNNIITDTINSSYLSIDEKKTIHDNITINVTNLADQYPEIDFFYFYPPYSAFYWYSLYEKGEINKQFEILRYVTDLIVSHTNIHLYSFNSKIDIISDLNNYRDANHYGSWINSIILKWMKEGECQITLDNKDIFISKEQDIISNFDYESLNTQTDYEYDFLAAALINHALTGATPKEIFSYKDIIIQNDNTEISFDSSKNSHVIYCYNTIIPNNVDSLGRYLYDNSSEVVNFSLDLDGNYNYLVFKGQKSSGNAIPTVYVYDETGSILKSLSINNENYLSYEENTFVINLSDFSGKIQVIFGLSISASEYTELSQYLFYDIYLY